MMVWERLAPPWRWCIEEAWMAYCAGSLPIGAAVTDRRGNLLARGRNRIFEREAEGKVLCGHRLAHAEINALLELDWQAVVPQDCVLYTTTEPCPFCCGAIRMARLQEVHFASRDGAAGSADLFEANPFMQRGRVHVYGPASAGLEAILIAMLVEFGLAHDDENTPTWIARLGTQAPTGLRLGRLLAASGELRAWAAARAEAPAVVDLLARRLRAAGEVETMDEPGAQP